MSHSRRRFLSSLGLAGLGLASSSLFLPSLHRPARANPGDGPPRRLLLFCTQHGTWYDGWKMRWPGRPDDATWVQDLALAAPNEFSAALAPLHPWRDKLNIVDGLALVSGEADPIAALRHEIGQAQLLTGAMVIGYSATQLGGAASIDQRVADACARPDRLRSLELAVNEVPMLNYRDAAQPLPCESRPDVVWDRVYGLVNGGGAAPQSVGAQRSVLDRVGGRYEQLESRLSGEDKQKIEQHRTMVRELEQRVAGLLEATCGAPERLADSGVYPDTFQTQAQMLATAFSCDLVRVGTIQLGDIPAEELGYPGVAVHDEFAHNVFSNAMAAQAMTEWSAYHASQFAEVLAMLDAVPEGNGTMLDNTLVVWASEIADGAHGFERTPVVIAGGGNFINQGKYIHYPSDVPFAGWRWNGERYPAIGRPHQRLLTSIGQIFGVTDESGAVVDGMPVREVYGIDDAKIDCTGIIEELFA